jgi:hypothetical protein
VGAFCNAPQCVPSGARFRKEINFQTALAPPPLSVLYYHLAL